MFFRHHFECEGIGQHFEVLGVLVVNAREEKFKFVRELGPILEFRVGC